MTRQFFARMAAAVMIIAAGLLGTVATAQNRAISGTVVDESGAPVERLSMKAALRLSEPPSSSLATLPLVP